jgi:signal transduction histidine kinase
MSIEQQQAEAAISVEQENVTTALLSGRWLMFARIAWMVIALLALGLVIASIPRYYAFLHVLCTDTAAACRNSGQITSADLRALQALGVSLDFSAAFQIALYIVFTVVYVAIGIVVFWRKSADRMALFASLTLVMFPAAFNTSALATLPPAWLLPGQFVAFLGDIFMFLFFYLFPTGQFVPRWTRWLWGAAIVFWAVDVFSSSFSLYFPLVFEVTLLGFVCSMLGAQIYRYRYVSNAGQRQQTKWVVFGISIGLGGFLVVNALYVFFPTLVPQGPLADLISSAVFDGFFLFVPLSISIAILRSRLFDIDVIINRTLVYALLSACVVGVYVLVVSSLGALFQVSGNILISLVATALVAILFDPLRTRLQQGVNHLMYGERDDPYRVISHLGERLEATLVPDALLPTIVETVALAMKLPYTSIELKEGEQFRSVATYGTTGSPILRIPLQYQQETIGHLLLAPRSPGESFTPTDRRLLDDFARQAGIAAHTVRLTADLLQSRERLLLAREEERRRLARELHDSVSQALYGISLGAHTARTMLERDPARVAEPLNYVLSLTEAALAEMRALIFELRPESMETEGLVSALTKQAAAAQARHNLIVSTDLCQEPDLPLLVKQDLYRIAQEAIHNTVKHAHARKVELHLDQVPEGVLLEVRDDGVGFDATASFPGHLGLHSMRERITNLGGTFQIESTPGTGTRIVVYIPNHV